MKPLQRSWSLGVTASFGRFPLAADGRHNGAFLLQGVESLVDHFAVEAGDFGDFTRVDRCANLAHGLQYLIFCFHFSVVLGYYSVHNVDFGTSGQDKVPEPAVPEEPRRVEGPSCNLAVSCPIFLFQHCLDISFYLLRLGHGSETLDDAAVFRDEKLGEVPAYATFFTTFGFAQGIYHFHRGSVFQTVDFLVRNLLRQILEDGMRVLAEDIDFLHQREGHTVVEAAKLGDFLIGAGLLVLELVAGEAEDHQTLVVQGLKVINRSHFFSVY